MSFLAGAITGTLALNLDGFIEALHGGEGEAEGFKARMLEMLSFEAIADAAKEALKSIWENAEHMGEAMHEAAEEADKAGVSIEFMSTVGKAAEASGGNIQSLGEAMKFLERQSANAIDGQALAVRAFTEIGISADDLKGKLKDPEQLFYAVADAIKSIDDPSRRTQAAMDLMSRAGADQLPLLSKGSEEIKALAAQIQALGGGFDENDAKMGDSFTNMNVLFSAAMTGIEKEAARPVLQYFQDHQTEVLATLQELAQVLGKDLPPIIEEVMQLVIKATPLVKTFVDDLASLKYLGTGFHVLVNDALGEGDTSNADYVNKAIAGAGINSQGFKAAGVRIDNVNVSVDVDKAADQIGRAVAPHVKKHAAHLQNQMQGAAKRAKVAAHTGGV